MCTRVQVAFDGSVYTCVQVAFDGSVNTYLES